MEAVIHVENIKKTYGKDEATVYALNDVSLTIKPGEFTAIVGPSGSGKSTLLHVMSGLDIPNSGKVALAGRNITTLSTNELSDFRRDHIGFIFQAFNLIPVLSAAENIEYILLLQKVPEKERNERVRKILKEVGLSGKENRRPGQLSGGQQQRVAVARAMVSNPSLILADEPTANLDSKTGSDLLAMMRALNEEQGMTFIFSTHDPKIMEQAKRLVVLRDGKIAEDETRH